MGLCIPSALVTKAAFREVGVRLNPPGCDQRHMTSTILPDRSTDCSYGSRASGDSRNDVPPQRRDRANAQRAPSNPGPPWQWMFALELGAVPTARPTALLPWRHDRGSQGTMTIGRATTIGSRPESSISTVSVYSPGSRSGKLSWTARKTVPRTSGPASSYVITTGDSGSSTRRNWPNLRMKPWPPRSTPIRTLADSPIASPYSSHATLSASPARMRTAGKRCWQRLVE